jgi:hypothetical protein
MKIVINRYPRVFGGLSLSPRAERLFRRIEKCETYESGRDNPTLVKIVEKFGEAAEGSCTKLKIVEVPDGTNWYIQEHDEMERVAERHRTWE